MMQSVEHFGVVGDPVDHSLSPLIHQQFAAQFGHSIDYRKYPVKPEGLARFVDDFFASGGRGLNVTVPHKQEVIGLLHRVSREARLANSVNTISLGAKGELVGDTTDGEGLLLDLALKNYPVKGKRLLVIGAGGASQAILVALLNAGAQISLHNRTTSKIPPLLKRFSPLGQIKAFEFAQAKADEKFDLVINTASSVTPELMRPLGGCFSTAHACYDLNYGARAQAFKQYAQAHGCEQFSDGWGMLVAQAAKSYQIWRGQLPQISAVNRQAIMNER